VCAGVSNELKIELQSLKRQLEDLRSTMNRRASDLEGKEELAITAKNKLEEMREAAEIRRKEGETKVLAARAQALACSGTVKRVRNAVDVSRSGIMKLKETLCEKKAQQDSLNREASLLLADMPDLEENLRRSRDRLSQYWSKSTVFREFCSNCQGRYRLKLTSSTLSRTRGSARAQGNKACSQCQLS
jgi:chromosome segregation ATPase